MFDIGASELLLIVIVAVVVIGPKDLPLALRTAGRWIGKIRRVSGHFRAGVETMIREAELAEMEKKWREQNEAIMREHPPESASAEAALIGQDPGTVKAEEPATASPEAAPAKPKRAKAKPKPDQAA
ncbi:Sec-independent protein translocase protein TatB [Novosphingobium ginsenosidimutans]|uniref:Sec-independent protein translocase protein TatB n=1 Tax=Novosphingobium ginsenosidimutans TaxID=1176536 RepID=A0A5B8S1C4_9SPHN|nr:Sec-independent protein translocase protein TatB [Novosphingobium ginsenosidimutans]QEA14924.1 twin-arginine translocase subunit TatB [Novosphingobium ginsenosidimutans]